MGWALWIAILVVTSVLPGCAYIARNMCNSDALRKGDYLGRQYTGESCSTTTSRDTHDGVRERTTTCTPTYEDRWQWNASSDRYVAYCLADVERRYPSKPATGMPPLPPLRY